MGNYLQELAGGNLNLDAKPRARGRDFRPWIVTEVEHTDYNDDTRRYVSLDEVQPDGSRGFSWGIRVPDDLDVKVGDIALLGIDGFNHVGFCLINGTVIRNYDAEDYEREHREMLNRERRRRREFLDANREQWMAVESYLSEQSRARIQYFRDNSTGNFELDGWGYELCIGELTDMLVESNLEETDEIRGSLAYQSCSVNQFDLASALAREVLAGRSIAGTAAGLSPITGNPTY